MKANKFSICALCALLLLGSCSNMSNTAKGGLIGAGSGALIGGLIGRFAGNTVVGAAVGTAVGTGAGVLIGKKMDKVKAEAAKVQNAQVEEVKDKNGLKAVKVTFDSGILFATNKADLSSTAKTSLAKFAEVLKKNTDMDIAIYGHTDSTGTDAINDPLSLRRAQSVEGYLSSCGVTSSQFKDVLGKGSKEPVASNATSVGRTKNRRVEVYLYASEEMIQSAQKEAGENSTVQ